MIALASPALVLSLSSVGLDPVAFTARASACHELPANIHADDALRAAIAQLLAHELEHVTEFIDRVDFKTLARAHDGQVAECRSDGSFESKRAQKAGRAAAAEIEATIDPAVRTLGRGLVRGARARLRAGQTASALRPPDAPAPHRPCHFRVNYYPLTP